MKRAFIGITICIALQFILGCGDTVNRRTVGEGVAIGAGIGKDAAKGADQGKKSKKKPDKVVRNGRTLTATFDLEARLLTIRPPVDYYFALDSSLSMSSTIDATMQGVIKIADAVMADESFAGRSSDEDTITILMDRAAFPNVGKEQATATHDGVTFTAMAYGEQGNNIQLGFDGVKDLMTIVDDWNAANPTNTVQHNGSGVQVLSPADVKLSGGTDLPSIIKIKDVTEEYRGTTRPFYRSPEQFMLPYTLEYLKAPENPNVGRVSVAHIFMITDSFIASDSSAYEYLFNFENQFALSAWAPLGLSGSSLCAVGQTAEALKKLLDDLEVQGKTAIRIDRCSNEDNTTPEFFANIVKATEYKEWVFPEYYWIGENPDLSKPLVVKIDGRLVSPESYEVISASNAIRFKSKAELIGKSQVSVTYTTLP